MKSLKKNKDVQKKVNDYEEVFRLIVRTPFDSYIAGDMISERNDIKSALLRASQNVVKVY